MFKPLDYKNLQLGDVLYEFFYGSYVKSEVVEPSIVDGGRVTWKSKNVLTGEIIDYMVSLDCLHYSPKLYTYMAYCGCKQV